MQGVECNDLRLPRCNHAELAVFRHPKRQTDENRASRAIRPTACRLSGDEAMARMLLLFARMPLPRCGPRDRAGANLGGTRIWATKSYEIDRGAPLYADDPGRPAGNSEPSAQEAADDVLLRFEDWGIGSRKLGGWARRRRRLGQLTTDPP